MSKHPGTLGSRAEFAAAAAGVDVVVVSSRAMQYLKGPRSHQAGAGRHHS